MIMKVFALRDSKAKCFGPPFYMQERAMAIRALSDLVKDGTQMAARHPEDFTLYQLGEYDDFTGVFTNQNPHDLISMASDFKPITPQIPLNVLQNNEKAVTKNEISNDTQFRTSS